MRTNYSQQRNLFQAKFGQNALIQLVMAIGVGYVLIQAIKVILIIVSKEPKLVFSDEMLPNIALQSLPAFIKHPWVLFTYFWGHASFWNLVSNMLWLYCFGSVIQTLIGSKEIVLLYIVSCVFGGVLYLGFSYFWPALSAGLILTALPGVVAFATAAIVLSPKFKFYLGERLAIPLWVVLLVFVFLNLFSYVHDIGLIILLAFSAITGAVYIQFIKSGYRPGSKLIQLFNSIQGKVEPDPYKYPDKKRNFTLSNLQHQHKENKSEIVDKILDKINQKGFKSLTEEEKDTLKKASDEIS